MQKEKPKTSPSTSGKKPDAGERYDRARDRGVYPAEDEGDTDNEPATGKYGGGEAGEGVDPVEKPGGAAPNGRKGERNPKNTGRGAAGRYEGEKQDED